VIPRGKRQRWGLVFLAVLTLAAVATGAARSRKDHVATSDFRPQVRAHLDHNAFFSEPFATPQAVTRACLECHPHAARDFMKTAHWQWLGAPVSVPGHEGTSRIGKKNLLNNFCISITGNFASCTKCHAGYGWADTTFDFDDASNVDCLVCHERIGTYVKGEAGNPDPAVDLLAVAKSVGFPKRENCTVCHAYGGGGQGVKHGDLDSSLENPSDEDDVHMGRVGLLCIDCHRTEHHDLKGRAFSVSVENSNGIGCTDCHQEAPHQDARLNSHLASVACETCHIPTYARRLPSKTFWDWSKAGDPTRPDDPHHYLKIKGEFVYDQDIVPEYYWFNQSVDRYLMGDRIDPTVETDINRPHGDIHDPSAKITPFKVHRALQPYDTKLHVLLAPVTSGEGGYWESFDWDRSLRLGAAATHTTYSGQYDFARTQMFWPLSHMVVPKEQALDCRSCHGAGGRLDWAALGYDGDPIEVGGRLRTSGIPKAPDGDAGSRPAGASSRGDGR
jgi:octaheme c-type cytochrome (tetrathionate reductase family)